MWGLVPSFWGKVERQVREMGSITGTFQRSLDAKDRLMLPAKLQDDLGPECYLAMGIDRCLSLYPEASWQVFTEKYASLPISRSREMRPLFANAVKCRPDSQGRITIPPRLQKYAGISKDVAIIGVHDRAEIWDAQTWFDNDEEMTPERMTALMEAMDY